MQQPLVDGPHECVEARVEDLVQHCDAHRFGVVANNLVCLKHYNAHHILMMLNQKCCYHNMFDMN